MAQCSSPSIDNRRQAANMLLGFAAMLVVGDWVLSRTVWPHLYDSRNGCRWKWDLLTREPQPPEVLFLGCSFEWCGISPREVERVVVNRGGRPIRGFNAASSAASAVTTYLMARRIVEEGRKPAIAYVGVSPAVLDVAQRNWFRNGLRALADPRDLPLAFRAGADMFAETLVASFFHSYHRWDDARLVVCRAVLGAPIVPEAKLKYAEGGWAAWSGAAKASQIHSPGWKSSSARTAPPFDLAADNANVVALRRTVSLLREAGVEVRFVEMPQSSQAAPWDSPTENVTYRKLIDDMAAKLGVPIVRAPQ